MITRRIVTLGLKVRGGFLRARQFGIHPTR